MTRLTDEQWWIEARAVRAEADARTCCACQKAKCRIGEQDGHPVSDVLCTSCFEGAHGEFKLTCAQDVHRDLVKAGVDQQSAIRAACLAGRGEFS